MTIEGLIRRRFVEQSNRQLVLTRTLSGRWQASMLRPDGAQFAIQTDHVDPVEAVRDVLSDFSERRRAPALPADLEDLL